MAKYSKGAQQGVESAMKRMEKGKLRSGKSNKKVTNPKQAIAIGLSEAKEKGAKVPPPPKKVAAKRAASKKAMPVKKAKSAASKKAASSKASAAGKKAESKKTPPKKTNSKHSNETIRQAEDEVKNKEAVTSDKKAEQQSPVEEKRPSVNASRNADPFIEIDKKLVSKLTSKVDPKHNMPISSVSKGGLKPSGKKPLWNR